MKITTTYRPLDLAVWVSALFELREALSTGDVDPVALLS
jgi:hypothetical protein